MSKPLRSGSSVCRGQRSGCRSRLRGVDDDAVQPTPRSNPGNRHQYKLVNGPCTLYVNTPNDNKTNKDNVDNV